MVKWNISESILYDHPQNLNFYTLKLPLLTFTTKTFYYFTLRYLQAVFRVGYGGCPEPVVTWSFHGEVIEPDDNITINKMEGESMLVLQEVEVGLVVPSCP